MSETERVSTGYMTPADFPHGTPAGAEQGCKNGCPAEETGQTCRQASVRYAGDYAYRKLVDGGATVEVLREPELFAKVAKPSKAAKPRAVPEFPDEPVLEYSDEVELPDISEPVDGGAVVEVITTAAPKPLADGVDPVKDERALPEHGTTRRHARGCKTDEECPGDPQTGRTCRRALLDYQADWRRKKKEEAHALAQEVPVAEPAQSREQEPGEFDDSYVERMERDYPGEPIPGFESVSDDAVVPVSEPIESELEAGEWVEPLTALAWPEASQESPLAPPAESLALAVLRTQLADATEQRDLATGALGRAKERNVQLELELDVAKEKASRIPRVEYRDFPAVEKSYAEGLVIDPTEAGGVRVDLSGLQGPLSLSLEFKEHGLSDVYLTVGDTVATHTLEQAA